MCEKPNPDADVTCTKVKGKTPSRCRLNRLVGEGEHCARSSEESAREIWIDDTDTEFGVCLLSDRLACVNYTCVPVALTTEPCSASVRCYNRGEYCDGTCYVRTPIEAACVKGNVDPCEGSGYCDGVRCVEGKPALVGCENNGECASKRCENGRCTLPSLKLPKERVPGQTAL